jgi:peroxiredoxin
MVKTGDVAPDFKLQDEKGNTQSLYDKISRNAPLLVIFYKNNCPTCQYTFPHLANVTKKLGPEHFLAIAQDSVNDAVTFRNKYGFNFEVWSDVHPYAVSVAYGLDFVPTFFVIEKDKKISLIAEGFDKKAIEDFSARIAAEKKLVSFQAFDPAVQVPLLKPG